jgi:hypothetical protein
MIARTAMPPLTGAMKGNRASSEWSVAHSLLWELIPVRLAVDHVANPRQAVGHPAQNVVANPGPWPALLIT